MALAGRIVRRSRRPRTRAEQVARGRLAKVLVLRGSRAKTVGGLTAEDLIRNKRGRVVSKRRSALGKARFVSIEPWVEAVMQARKALELRGFVPINGRTLEGKALYVKSKAVMAAKHGLSPARLGTRAAPQLGPPPSSSRTLGAAHASASAPDLD